MKSGEVELTIKTLEDTQTTPDLKERNRGREGGRRRGLIDREREERKHVWRKTEVAWQQSCMLLLPLFL